MPKGILNWFANQAVHIMNFAACLFADKIVTYTQDYADNSSLLRRFSKKIRIIDPPVELPKANLAGYPKFPISPIILRTIIQ